MKKIGDVFKEAYDKMDEAFKTMHEVFKDYENINMQEFTANGITTKTIIKNDNVIFYVNGEKVHEESVYNDRKKRQTEK